MQYAVNLKDKINKIISSKGISKTFFAKQIGMSLPGFNSMIEVNDCKLSTLFKICEVYHISIDYLIKNEAPLFFHEFKENSTATKENSTITVVNDTTEDSLMYKLNSCREINERLNKELFAAKDELVNFKRKFYKENHNNG
jgi:DNA-binding Xre family transcriptional regulator